MIAKLSNERAALACRIDPLFLSGLGCLFIAHGALLVCVCLHYRDLEARISALPILAFCVLDNHTLNFAIMFLILLHGVLQVRCSCCIFRGSLAFEDVFHAGVLLRAPNIRCMRAVDL